MQPQSYAEHGYWERYQPHFPARLRTSPDQAPREEWWEWRSHLVHIDRLRPETPRDVKILLIHGGGGNGRLLLPAARILADAGYEVVAPDLPGFGMTRVDPDSVVRYGDWLDLLLDLVEREWAKDGRPIVAFGMSVGGISAYNLGALSPHVVGVMATMLNDPRLPDVRRFFARTPATVGIGATLLDLLAPLTDGIRLPMRWFSNLAALANDPALAEVIVEDPHVGGARVQLGFLRTLLLEPLRVEPEAYDGAPILVVHPDADRWTPAHLTVRFLDRIPSSTELVRLENAGHFPLESPGVDQMERAVRRFVESIEIRLERAS